MHQLGYFEPSTDMSVSEKEECLPPKQLQQAGFIAYTGQASDGQLTPGDLELLRETKPGAEKGANAKAIYIMRCTTRLYGLTTIAYTRMYSITRNGMHWQDYGSVRLVWTDRRKRAQNVKTSQLSPNGMGGDTGSTHRYEFASILLEWMRLLLRRLLLSLSNILMINWKHY